MSSVRSEGNTSPPPPSTSSATCRKRKVAPVSLPGRQKKNKGPPAEDPELAEIVAVVKLFVRLVYPWPYFLSLITYALHIISNNDDLLDDDEHEHETPEHATLWDHWLWLKRRAPMLETRVARAASENKIEKLARVLDAAAVQARSDDTHAIKTSMYYWLCLYQGVHGALNEKDKSLRGFHHDLTGAFLCPVEINWLTDEEHTNALRLKEFTPDHEDFPRFIWRTRTDYIASNNTLREVPQWDLDLKMLWKDFGQGHLLVKTFAKIYASAEVRSDGRVVGIKGLSKEMEGVTSAAIAWAAVMARFALSDEGTFQSNSDAGRFDHKAFYQEILDFLDDPAETEERDRLFRWWNRKFFPHLRSVDRENGESAIVRYRKERNARIAAAGSNSE